MEEKYGKSNEPVGDESSSDSEEEDDEGILASTAIDKEINATLQAIRTKDPRVYDDKSTFYTNLDDEAESSNIESADKPMYLSDYHRKNLLESNGHEQEMGSEPVTYTKAQDDLKSSIVREMHAAARNIESDPEESDDEDHGAFLKPKHSSINGAAPAQRNDRKHPNVDVGVADKDPELFLSNFMAARAWVPSANSQIRPFESDDDEEEQRAEAFEAAYNLRFEDPKGSNEKLMSHARDTAAKFSVRREDTNSRRKVRDAERAKREAAKKEREDAKARIRKLKIDETEERIRQIREAAGFQAKDLGEEDWAAFLDEGWDDDRWKAEMQKKFGEAYYAVQDVDVDFVASGTRTNKVKKPKWNDDINIRDLVPDFDDDEQLEKPPFSLSDDSDHGTAINHEGAYGAGNHKGHKKLKKAKMKEREESKRDARKERRKVEQLVDEKLKLDLALADTRYRRPGQFRYRETSPSAYGLTAHDILMASDSQLNQYAGLKKMAAFRDAEKKRRDKKRFGKKARLREWRKETFGSESGPPMSFADLVGEGKASTPTVNGSGVDSSPNKKRKRSKKNNAV